MAEWISTQNAVGFDRVILEEDDAVGVYIYVYETPSSKTPEQDQLQDDLEMAQYACRKDFGIPRNSWRPTNKQPNRP